MFKINWTWITGAGTLPKVKTISIGGLHAQQPDFGVKRASRALALAQATQPGPLLPILHAAQEQVGHVPFEAELVISEVLNLSRVEVHGVVTYYRHFRKQSAGRVVLQLFQAEACQVRGANELVREAE